MTISAGFVHSAVPGGGQAAGIHTAFTNNLSAVWTVHPQETFQAATSSERVYFVLEHSSGGQILFYVAEGSDADGNSGIDSGNRRSGYSASSHRTLWAAYDVNGGGAGSDSFYDNLYNNSLDPAAAGFWNQTLKTVAYRLGLWLDGWATCYLWVSEGEEDLDILFHTSTDEPGQADRVAAVVFSDQLVDDSSRTAGDKPDSRAGGFLLETDTADPPFVNNIDMSYHFDGQMTEVLTGPTDWNMLDQNDNTVEPDGDGKYLLQTMPVERDGGGQIFGVMRKDLAAFTGPPEVVGKVIGNPAGAAFMCVGRSWCTGFWGPLGDITP